MIALRKKETVFTALILATLMIALISVFTSKMPVNAIDGTKISAFPATNTFYTNETLPGTTFNVTITVTNVTELWNYQTKLTWNESLLDYVSATIPSNYVFAGAEAIGKSVIKPSPIVEPGSVTFGAGLVETDWSFNGTGILGQVGLRILTPPNPPPVSCAIAFAGTEPGGDTYLWDPEMYEIPYTPEDSAFSYIDALSVSISPSGTPSSPISINATQSVTFTANATGGVPPYGYDWYINDVPVPEAEDQAVYAFQFNKSGSTFTVKVKVTDDLGFQKSAEATVTTRYMEVYVIAPPLSAPNTYLFVDVGGSINFTVQVSMGAPPYKYEWFLNSAPIPSAINHSTWVITFNNTGLYTLYVKVTGSDGKFKQSLTITVRALPTPTTTVSVIPEGGVATFYSNETKIGDKIVFNVTAVNVNDLQNWQIKVTWDPTLLKYSDIWLPDDDVFSQIDPPRAMILSDVDFGPNYVAWGCTYINDPFWTFNGTGTLCQIELEIIRQPSLPNSSCVLDIAKEHYVSSSLLNGTVGTNTIPFDVETATYTYILVSPVKHTVLSYAVLTYTNTSIIANSILPNVTDTSITLFNITGASGTRAYVNFTLPKALIHDTPWLVYLNGADVTSGATITSDVDNTYVYLEFTFSSAATVKIKGTWIVPEFANMFIIALLIASLMAVILAKKSIKKKQ